MGLILASASPRRQELLRLITEDFTVFPAAVEESLPPALSVLDAAQYLARKKACAVAEQYPEHVVLGSDTTVVLGYWGNRARRSVRQKCCACSPEKRIRS